MSDLSNPYAAPAVEVEHKNPEPNGVALLEPLTRAAGWMKFLAIVSIVTGVLTALTVVGIIVAWIPIWLGIVLLNAANQANAGVRDNNPHLCHQAMDNLRRFFKISGIIILVYIAFVALYIVAMIIGALIFFSPANFQ